MAERLVSAMSEKGSRTGEPKGETEGEDGGGPKGTCNLNLGKEMNGGKLDIPILLKGRMDRETEEVFSTKGNSEWEKMEALMVALDGDALSWFQWWETCNSNQTWEEFKNALIERFQPVLMGDSLESLLTIKQEQKVGEFITQFDRLEGAVKGLDEQYLMGIFSNGLREEFWAELKLHKRMMKKHASLRRKI
ncbi:hypothetical protein CR513_22489, partial [Mucuna pruriens]